MILSPTPETLRALAARLRAGGLVGMPTETVYGLAARASDPSAVAAVFAVKGRPRFNPLIAHVASLPAAQALARFDERAQRLAAAFWPGPLTLVTPRRPEADVAELASAGLASIAVRVPAHPIAQALLDVFGEPLVAPSANRSGRISPTTAAHVEEEFGHDLPILDGGACPAGVESTIVGLADGRPAVLLRPGAIARAAIEAEIGPLENAIGGDAPQAPGQLESHYAPSARVRLNAERGDGVGEVLLGFGPARPGEVDTLSASGDLTEAAARLYAALRRLDAQKPAVIAVAPIPDFGLGEAINDRLRRAAAPRPPSANGT